MMLDTIFVVLLFLIYLLLWSVKRLSLIRRENIDPNVMKTSQSSLQRFMGQLSQVLMGYVVFIIIAHALNLRFAGLFTGYPPLDDPVFDLAGFVTGLSGLSLCLYAQVKMGKSWRVGIDENRKTALVTTGLYRMIRNPTYTGLFLLCAGIWLIWPTVTVFIFGFSFILFLEIQVRCEEDYLEKQFGEEYSRYKSRTKRYIPYMY